VQRALAKAPGNRFESAEAFREALAPAIAESPRIDLAKALDVSAAVARSTAPDISAPKTVVLTVVDQPPAPATSRVAGAPVAKARRRGIATSRKLKAAGNSGRRMLKALNDSRHRWTRSRLTDVVLSVAVVGSLTLLAWDTPRREPRTFPEVRFQGTALAGSGAQQHERDARLILADGKVLVVAGPGAGEVLQAVRYSDVFSISHSQGRDPFWESPDGPDLVVRVRGGALEKWGISTTHDWVSLLVAANEPDTGRFIVMHFDENVIRGVLTALEERTGRKPHVLGER
jgi:hypothetical protein